MVSLLYDTYPSLVLQMCIRRQSFNLDYKLSHIRVFTNHVTLGIAFASLSTPFFLFSRISLIATERRILRKLLLMKLISSLSAPFTGKIAAIYEIKNKNKNIDYPI